MPVALPQRCERPCDKEVISHGGPSTVSAVTVGPRRSVGSRAATFRTQLNGALAREDLGELYELWDKWTSRDLSDVPLDTRETTVVRRQAERIARGRLRQALSGRGGSLEAALREAEAVVRHWPYAVGVKSSLEYKAAVKYRQEREDLEEIDSQSEVQIGKVLEAARPWDEQQSTTAGSEADEETATEATADELKEEHVADISEEAGRPAEEEAHEQRLQEDPPEAPLVAAEAESCRSAFSRAAADRRAEAVAARETAEEVGRPAAEEAHEQRLEEDPEEAPLAAAEAESCRSAFLRAAADRRAEAVAARQNAEADHHGSAHIILPPSLYQRSKAVAAEMIEGLHGENVTEVVEKEEEAQDTQSDEEALSRMWTAAYRHDRSF